MSRKRFLELNTWRTQILLSFGYDPLQCPKCNHQMVFLDLYHKHKRVPLEELYPYWKHQTMGGSTIDSNFLEGLWKIYDKSSGRHDTQLVKGMTDSGLLDMRYFLIEDDELDDDEFKEGFYIF